MVCGLHTTSSNKRKENKIKKKLMTQHVGCTLHCHHPSGHLFPFYPFSSHSFNPLESLLLSSWWLKRQAMLVLLQRGGGGVVLGIAEVDQAALGWPTYGHWQGRSIVAVDGCAVVVVVWGKRLMMMCWRLDVGVWNDFAHFVSDWLWEFWDILSKKEPVHSFHNGIS